MCSSDPIEDRCTQDRCPTRSTQLAQAWGEGSYDERQFCDPHATEWLADMTTRGAEVRADHYRN